MRALFPVVRREAGTTTSVVGVGAGLALALSLGAATVAAQVAQGAPPPAAAPQPARTAAPVDITGTWAQVVTEDWQWRYITPAKGDYTAVPLTAEANKLAMAWDHDADVKAGAQCKAFGAAAIMRVPTRMQITWVDDNTLKFDWDLGTQTRTAYFDKTKAAGARSLQGHAIAEWIDLPAPGRGRGAGGANAPAPAAQGRAGAPAAQGRAGAPAAAPAAGRGRGGAPAARPGGLKMVTTNLQEQYLRMNGVPVSENAIVTDYLDIVPGIAPGEQWLIVRTTVEDPKFLTQPYITSQQFKKEANNSKWNPTPCEFMPRAKGSATQVPRGAG
jgi:hypothetical protein